MSSPVPTPQVPGDPKRGSRDGLLPWLTLRRLLLLLWWLAGLLLSVTLLEGSAGNLAARSAGGFSLGLVLVYLRFALFAVFLFGLLLLGSWAFNRLAKDLSTATPPAVGPQVGPSPSGESPGVGFPAPPTLAVAVWLVLATLGFAWALIEALSPHLYLLERFPGLSCAGAAEECANGRNLMVTMFAAGAGAMVTTVLGYLEHASEKRDFEPSYVPWYFARPAIAVLLGIVFYFLVKGGLLVTVGQIPAEDLNAYGLAGLAALVGLFSKQAVEKLREVFATLFSTRADNADAPEPQSDRQSRSGP